MIKIHVKSREENNSIIAALFLFQYSLFIPLMSYIDPTIIVGITGVILVALSVINNRKLVMNTRAFVVYLLIMCALVTKWLIDGSKPNVFMYFAAIALPVLPVFSCRFDRMFFLKACSKLAVINFFILFWIPFFIRYDYMRFGYGLLLTPIFLYIDLIHDKSYKKSTKAFFWILFIASFIEIALWGARGCAVTFILFFVLDTFVVHREKIVRNLIISAVSVFTVLNVNSILSLLQTISAKIGIRSYALKKYQMQLRGGFSFASSGRDTLYADAIEKIKLHPLIGNPMSVADSDGLYVHNLFLQVGRDFGVIAIVIVSVFVLYSLFTLFNKKIPIEDRMILLVVFSLALGRLLFSSVLWKRPEFWMLVCFQLVITNRQYLAAVKRRPVYIPERKPG